jgi:tetratricopeptide (TPR) repeat protein
MAFFCSATQKEKLMNAPRTWLPVSAIASLLLLSACATDGNSVRVERPQAATLERALADADNALAAGQSDKAQVILKSAASTYPADKTPWLHMAQIKFDRASYGEAIMHALEALQRDPNDKLANSIVAVSGLRLSTKALADLSQQNNLNGSLRSEAQDLAKLLRTSLGEDVLVPTPNLIARKPAPVPAKKGAAANAPAPRNSNQTNTNDPFGGLK